MENKYEIVKKLEELLKACRMSVGNLEYVEDEYGEYVIVTYSNGYNRKINVTGDSGRGMILDVVERTC